VAVADQEMYNVFLEEKRQRDRAASLPEVLSGAALKRREHLAQRYHTRVELFMRQKQIAGVVDAVNDLADVRASAPPCTRLRLTRAPPPPPPPPRSQSANSARATALKNSARRAFP
jgi:hypothetical protein